MKLIPQLSLMFNGQCEAAFKFYERALGGTITFMMTWGDSPAAAEVGAEWDAKIYHATLKIGDTAISAGDQPPDRYKVPQGFEIILQMDDPAAAERVFEALREDGRVKMGLQETHWAARFGSLIDQFGISWAINCEHAATA